MWLKCKFSKGMFSDELVVFLSVKGREYSFFVPAQSVRPEGDELGRLLVEVLRQGDQAWAVLPNDSRTTIPVASQDLVSA